MHENEYKIVEFEKWCPKCRYSTYDENQQPCRECMEHAVNLHSHRPVKYEKPKKG